MPLNAVGELAGILPGRAVGFMNVGLTGRGTASALVGVLVLLVVLLGGIATYQQTRSIATYVPLM